MEIYSQGKINYPKGGTMIYPSFIKNIPAQKLFIKDRKKIGFNFYFDTGAGLSFLLSKAFLEDSTILLPRRKPFFIQGQGVGGNVQMSLTVLKMVQVGKYRFYNVPTYLLDDENNVTRYPYGGGLLGNDILCRFNLVINYLKGEIYLHPNTHFNDAFDYSYTGLSIYYENEHIYVDDVISGSPAEKAGLLKGDRIISIGENFTNNVNDYKTILQSAKEKINIFINRNEKLLSFTITPWSIL